MYFSNGKKNIYSKGIVLIKCPVCEEKIEENKEIQTYYSEFDQKKYKLFYCPTCELQFWNPRKIEPSLYENECADALSFVHNPTHIVENTWHKVFFDTFDFSLLNPQSKILDIGCTNGNLLMQLKQRVDAELFGIDFDSRSIEVSKEHYKLENTYNMSLSEFVEFCTEKQISFDLVTVFEVLEHQDEPNTFIQDVFKILKPGGYIVGSVPNRERFLADLNRRVEDFDWPPHHFLWFDRVSIKRFFEINRFGGIKLRPVSKKFADFLALVEFSLLGELSRKMKKRLHSHSKSENPVSPDNVEGKDGHAKQDVPVLITVLKSVRNIVFLPFVLFYPLYASRGDSIYFEVKKI